MAYDLAAMLVELGHKLQNLPRYTNTKMILALNRGVRWVVEFDPGGNFDVKNAAPVPDPSDTSRYLMEIPLPEDFLLMESLSYNGVRIPELPLKEFINTGGEFSTATGPPFAGYFIRKNQYINIWPRPRPGDPTKVFQIYYVPVPTDMADDTDLPALNRAYCDAVISYAAFWLKRGVPEEDQSANIHLVDAQRERNEAYFNLNQNQTHKISLK